jgi:hypothetical protein
MARSTSRIDELRDFFLTEDRRHAQCLLGIGSLGDAPGLAESLGVEESEGGEAYRNGAR